ncbi:lamin tail domain-containing protein [Dactylosporangium sp. CA-152071]|uniref:lamin tail domain-containing protein n=1 Tax=Dactylosporangium sp. CA-152071 TaxID=3239933 RepID=UPI003D8AB169
MILALLPALSGVAIATTSAVAADTPAIHINEVESNGGTPGDWIELVNTGATAVDVSGWLVKDNDDTHVFTIAANTTVAPGGYLVVDVDPAFGLGAADSARLFAADGTTLVDSYTWTAHAATTYGRCPDGTGTFVTTSSSTRGAANDCAPAAAKVRINEVESNGGTPGDWVELLNTGATAVDLSGWLVKDNDDTHVFTIAANTTLAPGAYTVVDVDPAFGLGAADSARVYAADGTTLIDSYSWTAHAATTYGRCPDGTGQFATTSSSTRGAANDCTSPAAKVKINEVESNGGTPGDWVELVNTGVTAVDVSGWLVKDNDDTHVFTIAANTTLAPGAYLVLDVDAVFGLGAADSARLFAADGVTLVDSYTWTAHAAITYGRCPDGTGPFAATTASTRGAANACAGQTPATAWPGGADVTTADQSGVFGGNMSGLSFQGRDVLWAVKNGPGTLYRLTWDGSAWTPSSATVLHYADGTGDVDAEGVVWRPDGIYVSTERNNAVSGVSRPTIERYDGVSGTANAEWNLTADLPAVAANSGLEAITWVPDAYLTAHGFADQRTGAAYDPAVYPGHGDGLFLVGLEANGSVYAYALTPGGFTRVATFASGFPSVMDLEFEPETGHLWAVCDDTCNGRVATLDVTAGAFAVSGLFERPAGMPNLNNEGFAIAPQQACVAGRKPVVWSDDSGTDGHALRAGTVTCVDLDADDDGILDAVDPAPADPANATFATAAVSGRIVGTGGRTVAVSAGPSSSVRFDVGAGTAPAEVQLSGSDAAIRFGEGSYLLTGLVGVSTLAGDAATVAVTARSVPVTFSVPAGGSLELTDALTGIRHTGAVTVQAAGLTCGAVDAVVVGTTGNDRLAGTAGNDLIVGRGGNDTVTGGGGSDCVVTGPGNDVITTAGGDDLIDAGGGNNVVDAGAGANTVIAASGNDVITTGAGDDRIEAGGGNNVIRAGDGNNVVVTASGNDSITTGAGDDRVDAGNGNNTVSTGAGADVIGTGSGNDVVDCGAGTDSVAAGRGNNTNAGGRCESFGV